MKEKEQTVLLEKYEKLKSHIKSLHSVAVAYSGGVDSTLLLFAAREALGNKAIAITACSCLVPQAEQEEANAFCVEQNIPQVVFTFDALSVTDFCENPENRCYLCKQALFRKMLDIMNQRGFQNVIEGSNMDDLRDYRPGMQALKELGIRSPLKETGLYKDEIRSLSKALGLPVWNKPSMACLASRIPYGETITEQKLTMVEQAEQLLHSMGFLQARVRIHGMMARIEVPTQDISLLVQDASRSKINKCLKELGFTYIALDLGGYRTGSMNEAL